MDMMQKKPLMLISKNQTGQSLVEFAIGFPVLVLIMMAGFYVGMGMYHGQMASDAIREPTLHKFEMADKSGAVSDGELLTYASASGTGVDSVDVRSNNNHTAIILGTKTFDNPFLPLTFTVSQGIQKNLLLANTGSGESKNVLPPMRTPPWQSPAGPALQRTGGYWPCNSSSSFGAGEVEALREKPGEDTYMNFKSFSASAPAPTEVVMTFAKDFMGQCANVGAGECQAEYEDFMPDESETSPAYGKPEASVSYSMHNPPGMPGFFFRTTVWVPEGETEATVEGATADEDRFTMPIPAIRNNPEHGWYIDPSGEYVRPPASMVESCKSYRQAECAIDAGARQAEQVWNSFKQHCS